MLQKELEQRISSAVSITVKSAKSYLDTLATIITEELNNGWEVKLPWIGTFSISKVAERAGRNIKTWEAIVIVAHNKVKFKVINSLKQLIK